METKMDFTYDSYKKLINVLMTAGYKTCSYRDWKGQDKAVILRHDIDYSIEIAEKFAEIEYGIGVRSTHFVLVSTDMYNFASRKNRDRMRHIINMGHEIGLHFDEKAYSFLFKEPSKSDKTGGLDSLSEVAGKIKAEAKMLSCALEGYPVNVFSYHRPSKAVLEAELEVPGMINSYGHTFLCDFKYLSDSRRHWREPVMDIVAFGQKPKLHILTHPFWYHETEMNLHDTIFQFVNSANLERYRFLSDNFRNLDEVMGRDEVS